ncbi:MAG: DNA topoisomerase, partial [Nitrospinae bacterium]|nr:DNA topoisomerase [Nitrospinota bacterium]
SDGEQVLQMISLNPQELLTQIKPEPAKKSSRKVLAPDQAKLDLSTGKASEESPLGNLEFMVMSEMGYGFRFPASNLTETTKSGRKIMSLKQGDRMTAISLVLRDFVFMATVDGKGLVIATDQVSQLSGSGMGVKLMRISDSKLAGFKLVDKKEKITLVFEGGNKKEITVKSVPVYNRGSQGVILSKRRKIINIF